MHILINMNYIGFYLCYLLQTAKLINVLSSVLTQLFRKVKEVQHNFLWATGTFSVEGKLNSAVFKRNTTDHKTCTTLRDVFSSNIWIKNVLQEKMMGNISVLLFWLFVEHKASLTQCYILRCICRVSLLKFGRLPPPLALHSSWLLIF